MTVTDKDLNQETFTNSHGVVVDKVSRFGWTVKDAPGFFELVDKWALQIDPSYQRAEQSSKVRKMAARWSWVACGAIIVARREGRKYVIDGQQRTLAARRRSDVTRLPCLVYESEGVAQEARGFLDVNVGRKPIGALAKFRAMIVTGDKTATELDAILQESGYEAVESSSLTGRRVKCVAALLRHLEAAPEVFRRTWPLIVEICDGGPISERLADTLLYVEGRLYPRASLTNKPWRERLIRLKPEGIHDACARASAFYAKGGARVWAHGVIQALNKGVRHKLVLDVPGDDPDCAAPDDAATDPNPGPKPSALARFLNNGPVE